MVSWCALDQWLVGVWGTSGQLVYGGPVVGWCMGDQWLFGVRWTSG